MHMLRERLAAGLRPDDRQGGTIIGATLTVTIAAFITLLARGYVRLRIIRNVGWDDYIMLLAMVLCLVGQGLIIPEVHYGAGRHLEYIKPEDISTALKLNYITQPLYLVAIFSVKMSIGFFLLRIAVKPFYKRLIISIMVFMTIYTTGCFCTLILQCTDLRMLWDPTIEGKCWTAPTLKRLGITNAAINIVTDLAFSFFIPIPMLWNVQMNRRQKSTLICILGLGVFATAAAVVRFTYLNNYGLTGDWLWDSRNLTIWTVVECNIGIVAGSLPCLKPLFRTILGSTYGRGSHKTSQHYGSRQYGPGTKHRSIANNYASIHSQRTADKDFEGYGAAGKAYVLTTIDAKKTGEASKNSSGRTSPARSSTDNIIQPNSTSHQFSSLGGIAVTTKVDVTESHSSRHVYENDFGSQRPEAKAMV